MGAIEQGVKFGPDSCSSPWRLAVPSWAGKIAWLVRLLTNCPPTFAPELRSADLIRRGVPESAFLELFCQGS